MILVVTRCPALRDALTVVCRDPVGPRLTVTDSGRGVPDDQQSGPPQSAARPAIPRVRWHPPGLNRGDLRSRAVPYRRRHPVLRPHPPVLRGETPPGRYGATVGTTTASRSAPAPSWPIASCSWPWSPFASLPPEFVATRKAIAEVLERWEHTLFPLVLIVLGHVILIEAARSACDHLASHPAGTYWIMRPSLPGLGAESRDGLDRLISLTLR